MSRSPSNIILIGMPGAGKSTIGVILAKQASLQFVDTDILIQSGQKRLLQDIVDNDGYLVLRLIEEETLLGLEISNCVIATGGSAVYSDKAMQHLKRNGIAIFIDVDLAVLESRVKDYSKRGLAKRPDQDFADLFQERTRLYRQYADITISNINLTTEEISAEIIERTKHLIVRER
ncbi:MAG: shikimate kinase [Geobacteraceae bacterium]|nr:shikimate kinase [Geobacteraceae bacterium]